MKKILLSMAGALLVLTAIPKLALAESPATSMMQQVPEPKTKTFSGTILKNGDNFVLNDSANKLSFVLDDAKKASQYEGKKVKVTGTVDVATNILHVETIEEIV